ncbi:MAG: hypothetical protein J0H26_11915 [Alphaproteobacteria bacterium]|nr:hypothetical protein [Alphaproteobacteria bacterium]
MTRQPAEDTLRLDRLRIFVPAAHGSEGSKIADEIVPGQNEFVLNVGHGFFAAGELAFISAVDGCVPFAGAILLPDTPAH